MIFTRKEYNMEDKKHEINLMACPYANLKTACKYGMLRTTTICIIMENIAILKSMGYDNYVKTHQEMKDLIFRQTSFKRNKVNSAIVDTAIINMVMMGYLEKHGYNYIPREELVEAYKSQTFQSQCASLYQAESSRKLSTITIWIAVGSLFITCASIVAQML